MSRRSRRLPPLLVLLTATIAGAQPAERAQTHATSPTLAFGQAQGAAEEVEQDTHVTLTLKSQVRKQTEVLSKQQTEVARERRRRVTPVQPERGVVMAAYVEYLTSRSSRDGQAPEPDPIAGKKYFCRRVGEQVEVLTPEGDAPPADEAKLVAQNMETLGRANPLAEYLAGRRVRVGEKLTLPADIARRLLGLGADLGDVTRFELTLEEVIENQGRSAGRFLADVEAQRSNSSQMRLLVSGPMTIDAQTCRAVASELSGPIGMSQTFNDPRGVLQLDSTGRIQIRVASRPTGASR